MLLDGNQPLLLQGYGDNNRHVSLVMEPQRQDPITTEDVPLLQQTIVHYSPPGCVPRDKRLLDGTNQPPKAADQGTSRSENCLANGAVVRWRQVPGLCYASHWMRLGQAEDHPRTTLCRG